MIAQRKPPGRLIWLWFIFAAGIGLASFVLFILNAGTPVPASDLGAGGVRDGVVDWATAVLQYLVYPMTMSGLGVLILSRRPGHRIGQLLIAAGLGFDLSTLSLEWAVYGYLTVEAVLPGVEFAAWVANWIWVFGITLLNLIPAVFPDGEFLSRRWRWLIGFPLLLFALQSLFAYMIQSPMTSAYQIPNPFVTTATPTNIDLLNISFAFEVLVIALLSISVVVRYRASQQRERLQMKWMLFGVAIMAALISVFGLGLLVGLEARKVGIFIWWVAGLGPVLGIGVAMLRHQLYDIDIIIRRTLAYALLTVILALVYFGSVVTLQSLVAAFGDQQSALVTVISTLAIAALFTPLRRRVQDFIDRRFYRRKYDAEQTLAAFANTARDEVDMERLACALLSVVEETMQPASVSLMLTTTTAEISGNQRSVVSRE